MNQNAFGGAGNNMGMNNNMNMMGNNNTQQQNGFNGAFSNNSKGKDTPFDF